MLPRILLWLALVALVLVPGLHAHGEDVGSCVACAHAFLSPADALVDASPTAPAPETLAGEAPRDPESLLRRAPSVARPLALSPPSASSI